MDDEDFLCELGSLGFTVHGNGRITNGNYSFGYYDSVYGLMNPAKDKKWSIFDIEGISCETILDQITELKFSIDGEEFRLHNVADPDRLKYEGKAIPVTLSALNNMFPVLFPDYKKQLFYDELRELVMIDMSIANRPEMGIVPIDDSTEAMLFEAMELRFDELGMTGKYPSDAVRSKVLAIRVKDNTRNLFREWVESHEWDGIPRVRTWFKDVMGATAPPLEPLGLADFYLEEVCQAWFVGTLKRQYFETKLEMIPVLVSAQGVGKGTTIRLTAGQDDWYIDCSSKVDPVADFLETVRGAVIVELSEATQLRGSDADILKSFISKTRDRVRRKYAHHEIDMIRRFSLIASTNLDNIFTDITGNRRFFPMYCDAERAKPTSPTQYDVEQLWAEVKVLMDSGAPGYADDELEAVAVIMQDYGAVENSSIDTINDWLDDPMNGYTEIGSSITKAEILDKVFSVDPKATRSMIPPEVSRAFNAWANGLTTWIKRPDPEYCKDKKSTKRVYVRIAPPGERIIPKKLPAAQRSKESATPLEKLRRICILHSIYDSGERVPVEGLSEGDVEILLDEGYIYDVGNGTNHDYRVAVRPWDSN